MPQRLCGKQHRVRTAGSFGEHCDHVVALWRSDSPLGVLPTADLILHKEMALLFQTGVRGWCTPTQGGSGGPAALRTPAVPLPRLSTRAASGHLGHVAALVTGAFTLLSPEGLLGSPFSSRLQDFLQNQE